MTSSKIACCACCARRMQCPNRIEGRAVCRRCYKHQISPVGICGACDRQMRLAGHINGVKVCASCESRHRRAAPNGRCRECGKADYLVRGRCGAHYKAWQVASRRLGTCINCREHKTLDSRRQCTRCASALTRERAVRARLAAAFGRLDQLPPVAQALSTHLTAHRSPCRVSAWLDTMDLRVRAALRALGTGVVPTLIALQGLRHLSGGEQLVTTCLRAGVIDPPPIATDRVDRLLEIMKAEGPSTAAVLVKQFWRFYLAGRAELRRTHKLVDGTLESDRSVLRIAFGFLRYVLATRKRAIAEMTSSDVNAWMRQAPRSQVPRLRSFLAWLYRARIVRCHFTLPSGSVTPAKATPQPTYQDLQRRARLDTALPLIVRVALLIMTKCARYPREIVALGLSDIRRQGGDVMWIRFAHGMAQPLEGQDAHLLKALATQRRSEHRPWLFPSKPRPETHMTSSGLCRIIDAAGITVNLNELRNAAFRDLLKDFTPMELCNVLGMGPGVAEHWRRRGYTLTRSQKDYVNWRSRAHAVISS